ncbi:hypothetical protein GYH30_019724 [Glycine max]|uniref:Uncharacterized protein n=2 Tax=Glycine subgen. Soja TaxID=1462606 RepID=A0A0R0J981_SOYBN|nr:hypothetical protein GYH30_019724 [Glycine max]RZC04885.1 hypothetical protein D0Y65_019124 [Glycine soja]
MEQQKMKRAREGDDETQKGCFENNENAKKRDEEGCSSEALGVFDFPWLKDGVTTKPEDYLMDLEDNLSSLLEQEDSSFKAATACIDFSSEAKLEDLAWQPFESDVLELEADDVDYIWSSLLKQPLRPHPAATIFSINIV